MQKHTLDEIKAMFREIGLDPENPHFRFTQILMLTESELETKPVFIIKTGTTTGTEGKAEDAELARHQ
jgi:hypothetical protein